jgi:transposase
LREAVRVEQVEHSVEQEMILARVAGIDVAKASGMVCTRVPGTGPGRRVQRVWAVPADSASILELGRVLADAGIERVVMEATGVYWRPFFFLLEAAGLECWLVNARDVKNVPGRPKTDRLDAVWPAKLNERGMLRASFIPPRQIRELRDLTRTRKTMIEERTRHKRRVEKILEDARVKLGSVASDVFGLSGRAMLDALVSGVRDPKILAALARGSLLKKKTALEAAFVGRFTDHHAFLVRTELESIDHLSVQIDALTARIETALAAARTPDPPDDGAGPGGGQNLAALAGRLTEIPGIGPYGAQVILAEIGPDMTVFPTPGHLASWAKPTPRTIQSGAKNTHGPTGKGNPRLRGALGEAAMSAARSNTFLGARYRRIVKRRGHIKALVAIARSILVAIWHLIANPGIRYTDLGPDHHDKLISTARKTRNLVKQLEALGHTVTLTPADAG